MKYRLNGRYSFAARPAWSRVAEERRDRVIHYLINTPGMVSQRMLRLIGGCSDAYCSFYTLMSAVRNAMPQDYELVRHYGQGYSAEKVTS
jgi:hypothetical protein